jgi:hypothetical protein
VFTLVLLVLLVWVILTVVLAGWSLFLQQYLYTEATPGLAWRGPAAGSALTFILLIWLVCDYRTPGGYRPLWEFSSRDTTTFPELRVPSATGEEVYKPIPGKLNEYHLNGQTRGQALTARPPMLIVIEGDKRSTFKPERDEKGNFKQQTSTRFGRESKEPLRYLDESGRVMVEGSLGQLTVSRPGRFIGNLLLNLGFLGACFVSLWLLLGFQWPHALIQAFVVWGVVLLFVWPPVLAQVERTAAERAAAAHGPG